MTSTQKSAAAAAGLYGLVALIGGIIGFVSAGSVASLVAGGLSGLVLLASAVFVARGSRVALIVALVVSVALVGRFASTFGGASGPSAIAIIMVLGGLIVLVASALALASARGAVRPSV
jgi:uncharacterized membrane protein (UPF0136 family)